MDATEMFLWRHERMGAHLARLTENLNEDQLRERVLPSVNPLTWLLWHVARAEDGAVNLLVFDGHEVLDDAWCARLDVTRRDAGTGMTMHEVVELSSRIRLPALFEYAASVAEHTRGLVNTLKPSDLDEVVDGDRVHRAVVKLSAEPTRDDLERLWQKTTRGQFLVWLPLTHTYEHIGQAGLIRGLLGHQDRF